MKKVQAMMRTKRTFGVALSLIWMSLMVGCASYSERVAEYRQVFGTGDTDRAVELINDMAEDGAEDEHGRDTLVLLLEAGATARAAGRERASQAFFNRAERIYDYWQNMAKVSISREGISLLTNPATLPYRGSGADILMVNTYQALNELQAGKIADARQPLVRLDNHQKEIVAVNAERIEKTREAVEKDENSASIDKTSSSGEMAEVTDEIMKELPDTRGYELYVNPFSEYLYAFYHLYAGVDDADREMARFRMTRALSMAPENKTIRQDVERLNAGAKIPAGVYLFHENGMAPYREEFSILLPIYAGGTFSFVSIALPKLKVDKNVGPFASLCGGGQVGVAELVCDMEAVIAKEYDNDYPGILTRAIASATAKAVASYATNYAARQSGNTYVQIAALLGTALYQYGTATADTRSWNALPKHIGVGRIDMPADRQVTITQGGRTLQTLTLPETGEVWVICVRTMHANSKACVMAFKIR